MFAGKLYLGLHSEFATASEFKVHIFKFKLFLSKEGASHQRGPYKPQPTDAAHWAFLSVKVTSFQQNEGLEHKRAPQ